MANKGRVLYLLQYLQRCSDEDHPVTTAEIRKELASKGCPATVETVRDDINMIRGCGFDIAVNEKSGQSTTYSYIDRDFSTPELQILIDAVSSSQFITKSKSEKLIKKLVAMAGPSHVEELQPSVLSAESVKARNPQFLYIIQKIHEGIKNDKKISFQYYRMNVNKERVPRHDGEKYLVSPYATLWRYDRYFLIGYSDKREKIVVFRIDRMGLPELTEEVRVPQPDDFRIQDYTEKVFWMYDGPEEQVTLRCRLHMMDNIVDYFGIDVVPENINEKTFDVTVSVAVSNPFFAWVAGFTGDMTIAGPPDVKDEYKAMLQRGLDDIEAIERGGAP